MSTWYNRHRSVGPLLTYNDHHSVFRQGNCSNGDIAIQSDTVTADRTRSYYLEEMYDVITKNFRAVIRAGAIINNPMIHTYDSWTRGDINWSGSKPANCPSTPYKDYNWEGTNNTLPVSPLLPIDQELLDSLVAEASTKAKAKLYASLVPGLVILGELRETLQLLRSPLGGITKIIGKSRNKYKGFGEAARSSWLAGRYGWRPILHDIESIMEATVKRNRKRLTARASASGSSTAQETISLTAASHANSSSLRVATHAYSVRAGVLANIKTTSGYVSGLRLRDIPSAAWNLLPYSFVVDWFLNVGDYIEASVTSGNVDILAEWVSTDIISNQTETITPGQYSDYSAKPTSPAVNFRYHRTKQRSPGLPDPSLTFKTRSINSLLEARDWRVIDAIALLSGKRPSFARTG